MTKPLIEVQDVSMAYEGHESQTLALEAISFNIYPKDFIALLGPSGCGKSTLMNLIAGFIKPTSGQIRMHGKEIQGPGRNRGVVFQETNLYPWLTVEENIQYGLRINHEDKKTMRDQAEAYLKVIEMESAGKKYPMELSGGMMKRVALARTLINEPEIVLMDEPFSALDAITRSTIHELIRKLYTQKDQSFFLITHDIDEALSLARRIFVMGRSPGRILREYQVNFSDRIIGRDYMALADDPDFLAMKREIILLINNALTT